MATKKFDITALYKQVFGITGVRFAIPALVDDVAKTAAEAGVFAAGQRINQRLYHADPKIHPSAASKIQFPDVADGLDTPNTWAEPTASVSFPDPVKVLPLPAFKGKIPTSVQGVPIYEQIQLLMPPYTNILAASTPASAIYTFPDWPMFDISASWLIKKENTQGGTGTVKEYIQQDDYKITIRGFLINYASQDYPTQLVKDFWKWVGCGKSMAIVSPVINLLGISAIVVEDVKLVGVEGYMNIQPFEIECVSDTPVILQIQSKQQMIGQVIKTSPTAVNTPTANS